MDFALLGNTSVLGLQWGDEGKGKIVDLLTEHFDVVVRYAGGANAGHTVRIGDQKFALHLVPSGILRAGVINIIGPGVALDLEILCGELEALAARGIDFAGRLFISNRAHLVMPWHKKQDRLAEGKLGKDRQIGTTAKGIGPCYADKMLRSGALRVADLLNAERFCARVLEISDERNQLFAAMYGDKEPDDGKRIAEATLAFGARLKPLVADTTLMLHRAIERKQRILFEGAQGSLLDIHHGTFPYVTSSICIGAGAAAGAGVPTAAIKSFLGVIKAYSTRVGAGPFPTELRDATGDRIRERGHEYGTTTGRPRRCGWFDAFAVRYSIALSGVTQLVVMHLDTLSTFEQVRICTGYRYRGEMLPIFPAEADVLEEVEPVYESLAGWESFGKVSNVAQLPATARAYLDRLEAVLGVPITLVSVGAERSETLQRNS